MTRSNVVCLGVALLGLAVAACTPGPEEPEIVSLTARTQTMSVGDTAKVTANVIKGNRTPASSPTITWSSNHDDVATVDSNGVVKAVGAGTAIISAQVGSATGTLGFLVRATAVK